MTVRFDRNFKKIFDCLPQSIQRKTQKQIRYLLSDFFYPSLNTKRMSKDDFWEFRIDRQYRMTGMKIENELILMTLGMHDKGLGKK